MADAPRIDGWMDVTVAVDRTGGVPANGAIPVYDATHGVWRADGLLGANFLSVGAAPALTGAVRIETNSYITARHVSDADDIPLIGFSTARGAIVMGDADYPNVEPGANGAYMGAQDREWNIYSGIVYASGHVSPETDNTASLGIAAGRWGDIFAALPATDPAVAGQFFTSDAGGLAANLSAGARYVLVSDGP